MNQNTVLRGAVVECWYLGRLNRDNLRELPLPTYQRKRQAIEQQMAPGNLHFPSSHLKFINEADYRVKSKIPRVQIHLNGFLFTSKT